MNRRIWFLAVITLILTVALTACDRHSTSEKKAATAKIEKHLAEKYEKEFAVETADDLFIHVPGELTGDVVGFETQAYPVEAPEETFKVEYWEEKGIIEDDYINHLMAGKLKSELSELISPILGRDIKIDWIALLESRPERLNKSLLRLAPTWLPVSQVQPIYVHGLVLFQVTMKARANASPPKHAKATNISDPHSSKLLTPYEDLIIISVPSTGESQLAKEGNAQLLLLRIPS